jgi:hypothetical protein
MLRKQEMVVLVLTGSHWVIFMLAAVVAAVAVLTRQVQEDRVLVELEELPLLQVHKQAVVRG